MKITGWMMALLLLLASAGCKKESEEKPPAETFTKFPPPAWTLDNPGRYPATMLAVVGLPADLQATAGEGDELAAFIGSECRGAGTRIKVGDSYLFFVLIRGLSDEQTKITFKYYCTKTSYLYQSAPDLNFLIDDVFGTAQTPKTLSFTQMQ